MTREPSGQQQFVSGVNRRCEELLQQHREQIITIDPQAAPLADALVTLTSGGKKLRPVLAWLGYRAASSDIAEESNPAALELLGAGLELFQAAALVHDDIIDRSSTRRGQPSAHRRFELLHQDESYTNDPQHFGTAAGILTGDLALAWAAEAFTDATAAASSHTGSSSNAAAPSNTAHFHQLLATMHTEVMTGQYLDVLSESGRPAATESEALIQARTVLRYKAARYSTMRPLQLGAALAGATKQLTDALGQAILPVGEAFQLRDDLLGVFGDPASTGKPVGDDLREGKRTELIAYGLHRTHPAEATRLETMLGQADLSEEDVEIARDILSRSGAVDMVENSIANLLTASDKAIAALPELGVGADVLEDLRSVSAQLVNRAA